MLCAKSMCELPLANRHFSSEITIPSIYGMLIARNMPVWQRMKVLSKLSNGQPLYTRFRRNVSSVTPLRRVRHASRELSTGVFSSGRVPHPSEKLQHPSQKTSQELAACLSEGCCTYLSSSGDSAKTHSMLLYS